jgi:regulator of RNase E activity RraA
MQALAAREVRELCAVSTATISTVLFKHGVRTAWMRGPRPLTSGQPRIAGPAFTMRFVPAREDLATPAAWSSPRSSRVAVEEMPTGCIAVVDAMGTDDAGILGDIICERMARRGVKALVTDGVVRDINGVLGTGLPVWAQGTASPPALASLTFVGWQETIGCGGVCVFPGDIVVADDDGAVLVPRALLDKVLAEATGQERLEEWVAAQVRQGAALPGLYPPNAENRARYEKARGRRKR